MFDEPVEAEGRDYFRLGALEVSPDGKLLATLADYDGRSGSSSVRDLATGKDIETVTKVGIGQPVWTSDSAGIVFTEVNDNWRSYRARYQRLGGPPVGGVTLYEETEELGFQHRRRQVARPEHDLRLDRRQCDERSAVRLGR